MSMKVKSWNGWGKQAIEENIELLRLLAKEEIATRKILERDKELLEKYKKQLAET